MNRIEQQNADSQLVNYLSLGEADSNEAKDYLTKLDDASVGGVLRSSGAVAVRVEAGSQLCRQFSAVYPVVTVPALYFIDASDGVNVEVAGGDKTTQQLADSAAKALNMVRDKKVS